MAAKVYRGLSGMALPRDFHQKNAFGVAGGVEAAFMSTTTSREVAIGYAGGGRNGIVFEVDSPFARARELKEEYEEMAPHAEVNRDVVAGQLTSVGQFFHYKDKPDSKAELEGMIRLWQKSVHPDNQRLKGKPLNAGYAAALFSLVYQWTGDFEEELLLPRLGVDPADEEEPPNIGGSSSEARAPTGKAHNGVLGPRRRCRSFARLWMSMGCMRWRDMAGRCMVRRGARF